MHTENGDILYLRRTRERFRGWAEQSRQIRAQQEMRKVLSVSLKTSDRTQYIVAPGWLIRPLVSRAIAMVSLRRQSNQESGEFEQQLQYFWTHGHGWEFGHNCVKIVNSQSYKALLELPTRHPAWLVTWLAWVPREDLLYLVGHAGVLLAPPRK